MADCQTGSLIPPYSVACNIYWPELIEGVYYTYANKPLVVPEPEDEETYEGNFMTELARRLALADGHAEKIFYLKTPKASRPFADPAYKTDPHNNVSIPADDETDMRIDGMEYRNNKEIYDFWKGISEKAQNYLVWENQGGFVTGGESGFNATFQASSGVIGGSEMPNQIRWAITWKGAPMPTRVQIPT